MPPLFGRRRRKAAIKKQKAAQAATNRVQNDREEGRRVEQTISSSRLGRDGSKRLEERIPSSRSDGSSSNDSSGSNTLKSFPVVSRRTGPYRPYIAQSITKGGRKGVATGPPAIDDETPVSVLPALRVVPATRDDEEKKNNYRGDERQNRDNGRGGWSRAVERAAEEGGESMEIVLGQASPLQDFAETDDDDSVDDDDQDVRRHPTGGQEEAAVITPPGDDTPATMPPTSSRQKTGNGGTSNNSSSASSSSAGSNSDRWGMRRSPRENEYDNESSSDSSASAAKSRARERTDAETRSRSRVDKEEEDEEETEEYCDAAIREEWNRFVRHLATTSPSPPESTQYKYRRSPENAQDPYDVRAEMEGPEDPTILSIIKKERRVDEKEKEEKDSTGYQKTARRLLNAFHCVEDNTTDNDVSDKGAVGSSNGGILTSMCSPCRVENIPVDWGKTKVYDEKMTKRFLHEAMKTGIPLLHHQPPSDPDSDEDNWTGCMVKLSIRPGNCHGARVIQPKLQWLTMGRRNQERESHSLTRIDLFDIFSIVGATVALPDDDSYLLDDIRVPPTQDTLFFSLTTNEGDVYVFEALSLAERDRVVNGLRSVVSRLSRQVITGDAGVCAELYNEDPEEYELMSGELPSLKTAPQAMNAISHAFLD